MIPPLSNECGKAAAVMKDKNANYLRRLAKSELTTATDVRSGSCVTNALSEYDGAELYER